MHRYIINEDHYAVSKLRYPEIFIGHMNDYVPIKFFSCVNNRTIRNRQTKRSPAKQHGTIYHGIVWLRIVRHSTAYQ